MAGEIAANGLGLRIPDFPATPTQTVDAGGGIMSPPRRKSDCEFDRPTDVVPLRPSQSAVDRVYQVKQIGIGATVILAILLSGVPGIFWAAPWMAENIWKPRNEAEILAIRQGSENGKTTAAAFAAIAENEKARLTIEERHEQEFRELRNAVQSNTEAVLQSNAENRKTRQKLEEYLESK